MPINWGNQIGNGILRVSGVGPTGPAGATGATGPTGATGLSYSGLTSVTSIAIATGSKTFTTNLASTGVAFVVGQRVRVASSASPANWMEGSITAFSGTSMTVNVDLIGGSGTIASWNISIAGATGSSFYDIAVSYGGTPTANEEIMRHRVARAFTMPATGHKGSCGTNPGSSTGFAVRKNGSTIGTVTFATNGAVTLTSFSATSFAADDIITIVAPASLNSIANIGITLLGTI